MTFFFFSEYISTIDYIYLLNSVFYIILNQQIERSMENTQNSQNTQVAGFVSKTFEILKNDQYHKIIFWSTSGKQFVIKDINKFQELVLPRYFRHRNVNSFIRQLNMYGFHKSRKQNTRSVFSHPYFMKDKEQMLPMVKRKLKNIEENINENSAINSSEQKKQSSKQIQEKVQITFDTPKTIDSNNFIKNPIQTKELIKTNMNMTINRFSFGQINGVEEQEDREDCISIEDEIQKTKNDFSRRIRGLNLINTSVFLDQMKRQIS